MVYLNFIDIKCISILLLFVLLITDIFKYVIDLNVIDIQLISMYKFITPRYFQIYNIKIVYQNLIL